MTTGRRPYQFPEGPRNPDLEFDHMSDDFESEPPVGVGEEDWRDGPTDDGEPTEEEALSISPEDDPEAQNDVA